MQAITEEDTVIEAVVGEETDSSTEAGIKVRRINREEGKGVETEMMSMKKKGAGHVTN